MEILNKAGMVKNLMFSNYSKPTPIVTHINITHKCNLKCKYCYGAYPNKQLNNDIPIERWLELIDELAKMGTKRINIGGGEPLVRKDIDKIIGHIRKRGILVNINTNGHLVKSRLDVIKKVNTLCISIDGDEKTHDVSKGKGSYQKVIEAIKFAKGQGVVVHTSTLLTKHNIHTLPSILEVGKKYGCMIEILLPFFQDAHTILPSNEDIKAAFNDLIRYKEKGYPISISYDSIHYILQWPDYTKGYKKDVRKLEFKKINGKRVPVNIPCYAGKFMSIINYNGYVFPCSSLVDHHTMFKPLKFTEVGFRKAFENTLNHECKSCYAFTSFNDYSLLLNKDVKTIWNYLKNSIMERKFRSK